MFPHTICFSLSLPAFPGKTLRFFSREGQGRFRHGINDNNDNTVSSDASLLEYDQYMLRKISSVQELRAVAAQWDDLWQRSNAYSPRAKADLLALWVEYFPDGNSFEAIIVERPKDYFLAALPLILSPFKGIFKLGSLATSQKVSGGDLLLDPDCDTSKVTDLMVSSLARSSYAFLAFDGIAFHESRWQELSASLKKAKFLSEVSERYQIGQVKIGNDWAAYEQGFSKKHSQNMRRQARNLEKKGETNFVYLNDIKPSQVSSLLRQGFEVEDRSWKGKKGTSVLKTPGMFEYLCKEADYLAEQKQLELAFLMHENKPIAFIYGWYSKGIHLTPKGGYDEDYEKFGPGQQMFMRFIQYLHNLPDEQILDFNGPIAKWSKYWVTNSYPVGRIFAVNNRFPGKLLYQLKSGFKN